MREYLHLFQKPSRFAAIEDGVCLKDPSRVKLRVALAFPDAYEIGMSYLGQKILLDIANSNPAWMAERVMEPDPETAAILKDKGILLCTLESDTPLRDLAAIGFSITHELCYTDILHTLDLGGVPLRTKDRPQDLRRCPLVLAGGGAAIAAEPVAPFIDLIALGDGEETLPEILRLLEQARESGVSRDQFLRDAAKIPGVYIPSLYENGAENLPRPARRVVCDLDAAPYPRRQILPMGAVHNRLALEIARGCARGCRFCQAGIVYRPARERSPEKVLDLLDDCLARNGFEEVSFLALSAGDYSALKTLWLAARERCGRDQVSLALPSLRVGSVDEEIMEKMASLRRVGCTLAPEAGSQRLRDVINKGIDEDDLVYHARKLLENGWRQVKLYFMIGLPTETDADLAAIVDLCEKVRDAGGTGAPRLQVTAAVSPFVPKPFTPFQWEEQIVGEELTRRIFFLRDLFKKRKSLIMRWHNPEAAFLEGVLSRGDRRLADVVELAYKKGALYCAWIERFSLAPWLEACAELGVDPAAYVKARPLDAPLPWSHLNAGVEEQFLARERAKAFAGEITPDCRYGPCQNCGACDMATPSLLAGSPGEKIGARLVFPRRDQREPRDAPLRPIPPASTERSRPRVKPELTLKTGYRRIWHNKTKGFAYVSNLELQSILRKYARRAGVPLAFSQGFRPAPLTSFGRALPVGVESRCEWFSVALREEMGPEELETALNACLPPDLSVIKAEVIDGRRKAEIAVSEKFALVFKSGEERDEAAKYFADFFAEERRIATVARKNGEKSLDLRPLASDWTKIDDRRIETTIDWSQTYVSPVTLFGELLADWLKGENPLARTRIVKIGQILGDGSSCFAIETDA